jgi:putative membrane protein
MTRQQQIKPIYIWVLTAVIAFGLWVVAGRAGININQGQNSNNQNGNTNTGNTNRGNANSNRSQNRNDNMSGGGMAGMSNQDHKFVMEAAMGGMMEVELGRVAAQQGASDAVKQFGQRMVDDHTKVNQELMALASSKGMTLPTALDEKHQQHVAKLQAMSGADFDRAYGKMMLSDHNKDVKEFEKQSTRATDPDLKAFASRNLPALQEHLQMARALPGAEGGGGDNMNNSNRSNRNSNRNSNGNSNRNSNGNSNGNANGNSNNSNRP